MTFGKKLFQMAQNSPPQDSIHMAKAEWQDLCKSMEVVAQKGRTAFVLPAAPEEAYPNLAANPVWLRARCLQDEIRWEEHKDGSRNGLWSFSWPLDIPGEVTADEAESKDRTKLRIGKVHLAYVRTDLLNHFRQVKGLVNLTPWLRQVIWERFHIEISNPENVKQLQEELNRLYYDSCGEWLQELMRAELRASLEP